MDMNYHHEESSGLNQQATLFQSSGDEQYEVTMMGDLRRMSMISSMSFAGNSSNVNCSSGFTEIGKSCDSFVADSVPGSKHRPGLAAEWSVEEEYKLEEALAKYANEFGMIKYVKIAAMLRNKTVCDVAIRCRWMAGKRRKHEELNILKIRKKSKDRKDSLMESSSKPSGQSISTINVAPLSVSMNHRVRGDGVHFEALQGSIRHLVEQNSQVLGQISTNISALKLQDNADLFMQMKNNVNAILNDMRCMPGPPVPVSLNEDLANSIISFKTQTMMYSSSDGMNMKQEPGGW